MRIFARACQLLLFITAAGGTGFAQTGPERQSATRVILREMKSELLGTEGASSIKCGTSILAWAYFHWHELPVLAKRNIAQALQRPVMQKNRIRPPGRFRVHYDTSTVDAPALISAGPIPGRIENTYEQYVDSVVRAFDDSWTREIDSLDYSPPPTDGQQGGGPEYDIYIRARDPGDFGVTSWQNPEVDPIDLIEDGPRQRFSTYIVIDNDYLGYRTPGMDGLKITAAHEFFHAIQVGAYGIWRTVPNSDFYFYELTSVWMEHALHPSIHDYFFDLRRYFQEFRDSQNRSYPFTFWSPSFAGYERSVWAHFLTKQFGRDIVREIWEGMRQTPSLQSVAAALQRRGSTFESEFALFSSWNYFTADRADTVRFYEEGRHYPRLVPNASTSFNGLSAAITTSAVPFSTQFYQFAVPGDTLTAVVANIELERAAELSSIPRAFEVKLTTGHGIPPYQRLSKGYVASFASDKQDAWRTQYFESTSRNTAIAAEDPSPNPFLLSKHTRLRLPLAGAANSMAQVYILSSSLDLVLSGQYPIVESFGKTAVYLPTADLRASVSSGIYFIVARCDGSEYSWKVAIVR